MSTSRPPRVIVVGGGTMGLASAWALARRGAAVTVLERFGHVHDRGSHSGHTRIIRQAYHEGSTYVPLVQQADREWLALGERAGQELLRRTGVLLFGPPGDRELGAAIQTCRECALPCELLSGDQARARWPMRMPDDWLACFDPSGGYLRVKPCLDALAQEARDAGAQIHHGVQVATIEHDAALHVRLADGTRLEADRVVVAAGAWLPALCPTLLPGRLVRQRRILAWTTPAPEHHATLADMPVWGAFLPDGFFYGFPHGHEGTPGLKLAVHTSKTQPWLDAAVDPDTVDRSAHPVDLEPLRRVLVEHLPQGLGPITSTHACLYTSSPTMDFVIDRLPDDPRVIVAGAFSGHGFKFAPAIGLHVAELLLHDAAPRPELAVHAHAERPVPPRITTPALYTRAAHLPAEVLRVAVWYGMASSGSMRPVPGPIPEHLQEYGAAFDRLPPADAALARDFGDRCWGWFSSTVFDLSDPLHVGSPRERAGRKQLRRALPFLDRWTFEVLWNVAFRLAMM